MKKNITVILSLMMIFISVSGCSASNGKELSKLYDDELVSSIDSLCKTYFTDNEFVGMSVGILKDGKVSYLNYGNISTDGDKATEDTIYEVASISKTFTGTLLANEVVKKNVNLDDPVQKYLDYSISSEYKGHQMTLENLATHTSGLPRVPSNWRSGPNPYKNYDRKKLEKYMKNFVLDKKPGVFYDYSNLSFGLLGCILEDVENKTYEELISETITKPLDMSSTKIFLNDELQSRKALPYSTKKCESYEWDFDALQACAGIKSTTRDLIRYLAANMEQIKCSKQLNEAFTMAQEPHYRGSNITIGLAWRFVSENDINYLEHDGLSGGYTSYCAFNKDNGVGIVILCNSTDGVIPLGHGCIEKLIQTSIK